jgi:hypothetical protein
MNAEQISKLAQKLGVTLEQAEALVKQEVQRKEAGQRYRQSEAYKNRLKLQKLVRAELKKL